MACSDGLDVVNIEGSLLPDLISSMIVSSFFFDPAQRACLFPVQ